MQVLMDAPHGVLLVFSVNEGLTVFIPNVWHTIDEDFPSSNFNLHSFLPLALCKFSSLVLSEMVLLD